MDDDQIGNSTMLQERVEDEDFLVRRELLLFGISNITLCSIIL